MTVALTGLETMDNLLNEMRPLLLVVGVPEEQINIQSSKHRADALARAFDWLHDLKMSSEYKHTAHIRSLLPEKVWKRYKLFAIEDLREQVLLNISKKDLLKKWRTKRPAMFNKNKKRPKCSPNAS